MVDFLIGLAFVAHPSVAVLDHQHGGAGGLLRAGDSIDGAKPARIPVEENVQAVAVCGPSLDGHPGFEPEADGRSVGEYSPHDGGRVGRVVSDGGRTKKQAG